MHWRSSRHFLQRAPREILDLLDAALMPLRCVFCGTRTVRPEKTLCVSCYCELQKNVASCPRCALPLATELRAEVDCAECQRRPPPYARALAPLLYEYPVDAAIKAMKYYRRLYYAPAFTDLLRENFEELAADADAVLPVPLHWRRQMFRGFNQAHEIIRPLMKSASVPLVSNVVRTVATPPQSGLTASARRQNLRNVFCVRGRIEFERVLIVDDVITTGETCRQLAKTILAGGAAKISVLALARTV